MDDRLQLSKLSSGFSLAVGGSEMAEALVQDVVKLLVRHIPHDLFMYVLAMCSCHCTHTTGSFF